MAMPDEASRVGGSFSLLSSVLPLWFWRGGICGVSSEIFIGPDYNHPKNDGRLEREFPVGEFHDWAANEVELRPGGEAALHDALDLCIIQVALNRYRAGDPRLVENYFRLELYRLGQGLSPFEMQQEILVRRRQILMRYSPDTWCLGPDFDANYEQEC